MNELEIQKQANEIADEIILLLNGFVPALLDKLTIEDVELLKEVQNKIHIAKELGYKRALLLNPPKENKN